MILICSLGWYTEKNARMLDADYTPLDDPHGGNYGQRT